MRFGQQFELHKIPEWYMFYLNYEGLKLLIEKFDNEVENGNLMKLPGFYLFQKSKKLIKVDIESLKGLSDSNFNSALIKHSVVSTFRESKHDNEARREEEDINQLPEINEEEEEEEVLDNLKGKLIIKAKQAYGMDTRTSQGVGEISAHTKSISIGDKFSINSIDKLSK